MKKTSRNDKKIRRVQLPRQEYEKLKRSAYELVVIQGKSQKEVAELLGVSEQSMSDWSKEGKWREERQMRQLSHKTDSDNTRQILRLLSAKRLQLEFDIQDAVKVGDEATELELRKQARALSDEIAKHNKTFISLDKENKITLGVYIDVMDDIFNSMRLLDEELFNNTIEFQSIHIRKKTAELG